MAETSKGKTTATWTPQEIPNGGDWKSRGLDKVPTEEECAAVRLPFKIYPGSVDCYSTKYTVNLRHLVTGQESGTPWTGYYANFKGAKLAVSNMFGAWFEIERRNDKWQAVRLARTELKLQGSAMPGLNVGALIATGEPTNAELVERARSESRASQHSQHDPPPHQDPPLPPSGDPGRYYPGGLGNYQPRRNCNDDGDEDPYSSRTAGRGGAPPDPSGYPGAGAFDDYRRRNDNNGGTRLEGDPPEYFEGDRGKTMDFLVTFKRFMIMN
jgi:hypothetical protein